MIKTILKIPRKLKQFLLLIFDSIVIISCLIFAFTLRLEHLFYPYGNNALLVLILFSPILAIPIFFLFGFYHNVIRYVGFEAIWRITQGVSIYAISWGLLVFMAKVEGVPRSVILINWLILIVIIGGSRLLARWLLLDLNMKHNVIIYGAGSAGRQLSTALVQSNEYNPIAFVDDSEEIYQQSINGLKVYSRENINDLIIHNNIKEVLIAIPSISLLNRNEIINYLEPFPVVVRSLPAVSELAQGKLKVNDLKEIDIRDLLGRELVKPNKNLLKINIFEKIVMVTGAGGSIGSEICRQIILLKPKKLVLYEISESSLYQVEQELEGINLSNIEVLPVIGSITNRKRVKNICNYYGIQTIYHAAAYKHVPLVEFNQSQGVLNNSFGTLSLAQAAIDSNVETFVLISTDKAVRPTNIMGASKRIAELILQSLAKLPHKTCFTMVRFGNVVDSSGSVIPLFRRQIKEGGPVTVTHTEIVRYFMSIPEAVELVLQAGAMGKGGEVFVLDMGKPVRIYDLAVKMINLSGLKVRDEENPDGDIEIKYTGLRPGEKLYEELLVDGKYTLTENKLIMCAEEKMISWNNLEPLLLELKEVSIAANTEKIYSLIAILVPEFKANNKAIN